MILRKPSLGRCLATLGNLAAPSPAPQAVVPGGTIRPTKLTRVKPVLKMAEAATTQKMSESAKVVTLLAKPSPWKRKKQKKTVDEKRKQTAEAAAAKDLGTLRARIDGVEKPMAWAGSWGKGRPPTSRPLKKRTLPPPPPSRPTPPHLPPPRNHLSYSRRVEGLLDPSDGQTLQDLTPTSENRPIANLAHGLDRVLFNPGVHWLRDPRSRVYNFPPNIEYIPKITDFAFERLTGFIKSSRDEDLWELAKREKRTFAGSTSSLTGMLSQIYFLISGDRDVDVSTLSRSFAHEPTNFTPGQRMPASVVMNYNGGVYAIDSDAEKSLGADKNILTWMGTLLEKYLTMTSEEFASYMRSAPPPSQAESEPVKEAYRYAKSGKFVMRSQLDCHDSRLPGTGVFDIKTRACLPIRLDLLNFEENSGYLIRTQHGRLESFEKEYYDLIRSAFLKYSFQVRIGNMDGVIVAYHNTERMFGFQYIPLEEMDQRLFGSKPGAGQRVFEKCISILELVADEIIRCFPKQSVKCTFETEESTGVMNVWVEPAVWVSSEERPIKQIEVRVSSYLAEDPVRGPMAVADVNSPWTIHWSISRLSGQNTNVREGLVAAHGRQFRAYNIPTGIDIEDMAKFWDNLNFSGESASDGEGKPPYNPDSFKKAGSNIELLRAVARAGREETKRLEEADAGKPKVVLGQLEPIPPEVIEAWLETEAQDRPSTAESRDAVEESAAESDSSNHIIATTIAGGSLQTVADSFTSQTSGLVEDFPAPLPTKSLQSGIEVVSVPDPNAGALGTTEKKERTSDR